MKFLSFIMGVLLIVVGVVAIFNPAATVTSLSVMLGLSLLICGVIDLVLYFRLHKVAFGAGTLLADGLMTIIVAMLMLSSRWIVQTALPVIFSMWVLFSAVARMGVAFELRSLGRSGWIWLLLLSIITLVLGAISLFHPLVASIAISLIVGVLLISQGVTYLTLGFSLHRFFS